MAYFARVINGTVTEVLKGSQEFFDTYKSEEEGQWIQTSYNTREGIHYQANSDNPSEDQSKALRGNFAGVGWKYDSELDVFYKPQPHTSWTLNTSSFKWEPPVPKPTGSFGGLYYWNEINQEWLHISSSNIL